MEGLKSDCLGKDPRLQISQFFTNVLKYTECSVKLVNPIIIPVLHWVISILSAARRAVRMIYK